MTDLSQIPRFTRYWLFATIGVSLLSRLDIIGMEQLAFSWSAFGKLQLWRCITGLFVHPLHGGAGFHFLINCYFIVQYSGRLEKDQFGRNPADYLYNLIIVAILANVGGLLFSVSFLMDACVIAITYIWCQLNKDVIVNFWFGARFKAVYLPWVLAGIEFLFNYSITSLIGIFIGHVYYFLKFQYPQELGGNPFLETPSILKRYFPDVSGGFSGFGIPPASRASEQRPVATNGRGNQWGHGHALGR